MCKAKINIKEIGELLSGELDYIPLNLTDFSDNAITDETGNSVFVDVYLNEYIEKKEKSDSYFVVFFPKLNCYVSKHNRSNGYFNLTNYYYEAEKFDSKDKCSSIAEWLTDIKDETFIVQERND